MEYRIEKRNGNYILQKENPFGPKKFYFDGKKYKNYESTIKAVLDLSKNKKEIKIHFSENINFDLVEKLELRFKDSNKNIETIIEGIIQ